MSFDLQYLRGYIEKLIDSQLTNEQLSVSHKFFEKLQPAVADRRDAIFGCVIGAVFAQINDVFLLGRREPTHEEIEEIGRAIKNRLLEIKSRINETFT